MTSCTCARRKRSRTCVDAPSTGVCTEPIPTTAQNNVLVAINHMHAEGKPTQKQSESVLKELQGFVCAANPFSEDFSKQFMTVYQRQLEMQNKLQVKKKKLNTKLRSVSGWMKVPNIILGATCAVVLLCRVIVDAIAAPKVAVDLAVESKKPERGMGSWLKPLCRKYERITAQAAIIEDASKGTFVAIQDLNNSKASVEWLKNETATITQNIRFGEDRRHDPYSLQVAIHYPKRFDYNPSKRIDYSSDYCSGDSRVEIVLEFTWSYCECFGFDLGLMLNFFWVNEPIWFLEL